MVDVAVVGAGPCGLAAAVAASNAGLSCVVFDRGSVVNSLVGYPIRMTFFSSPENLEIGDIPFVTAGVKPTRDEALTYYRRVAQHYGLDVHTYEEVLGIAGKRGEFSVRTRIRDRREATCEAGNVVVATGYFDNPNPLDVPGADLPTVTHYYREGHPYFEQDCLVIGGGNSAAEAALDLWRSGARVTVIHFLDEFDIGMKPWVRPDIENRIKEGSISAHFRTRVTAIEHGSATIESEHTGEVRRLPNDWVFAMTGYAPDTALLESLGVEVDRDTGIPSHDPQTMETNVPGIFIAGVLAAGFDANKIFIENGKLHGALIAAACSNRSSGPTT